MGVIMQPLKSLELFAGAGGLGLGVGLAGFVPEAVIEWDRWACDTIRENVRNGHPLVSGWTVVEGDVRDFDYGALEGKIDLLTGGPPCQPFSLGGKHRGKEDQRDMFPAAVAAVRAVRPKAFIIENVRGLTRPAFANYFQYIQLQFTYPEVARRVDEAWTDHLGRLERLKTSGAKRGLTYNVVARKMNAADYGVPQRRDRVFIVGFQNGLGLEWSFPEPTHSLESLLHDQGNEGTYWDRHGVAVPHQSPSPRRYGSRSGDVTRKPWVTVRDALAHMPDPRDERASADYPNHRYQPGARAYPGHTGSPLDLPSKALKAGDHGVPGGENMMVLDDGSVRYFTVREAARIQTFPEGYVFHGSWTETMRQLGNAVPVQLARVVAASVAEQLVLWEEKDTRKLLRGLAA